MDSEVMEVMDSKGREPPMWYVKAQDALAGHGRAGGKRIAAYATRSSLNGMTAVTELGVTTTLRETPARQTRTRRASRMAPRMSKVRPTPTRRTASSSLWQRSSCHSFPPFRSTLARRSSLRQSLSSKRPTSHLAFHLQASAHSGTRPGASAISSSDSRQRPSTSTVTSIRCRKIVKAKAELDATHRSITETQATVAECDRRAEDALRTLSEASIVGDAARTGTSRKADSHNGEVPNKRQCADEEYPRWGDQDAMDSDADIDGFHIGGTDDDLNACKEDNLRLQRELDDLKRMHEESKAISQGMPGVKPEMQSALQHVTLQAKAIAASSPAGSGGTAASSTFRSNKSDPGTGAATTAAT